MAKKYVSMDALEDLMWDISHEFEIYYKDLERLFKDLPYTEIEEEEEEEPDDFEEPDDLELGFNPYMGCYDYDC